MGKVTGFLEIDRRDRRYAPAGDRVRHTLRWIATLMVPVLALLQLPYAKAQTLSRDCPACRATYIFGICDEATLKSPPDNTIGVVATVLESVAIPCGVRLFLAVKRASDTTIRDRITVDVLPCLHWSERVGREMHGLIAKSSPSDATFKARICPARAS